MIKAPRKYKLSSRAYQEMIKAGILSENDRVELINGEIIEMTAIGSRHAACVNKLNRVLGQIVADKELILSIQNPIWLSDGNEPEPDLCLLEFNEDFYASSLPSAKEIHLLIEVADSSLDYDQNIKLPLYARANIPELWIIDLNSNKLISYQNPENDKYLKVKSFGIEQSIKVPGFPEFKLKLRDILPGPL